jgi:hypothetical protein
MLPPAAVELTNEAGMLANVHVPRMIGSQPTLRHFLLADGKADNRKK